MNATLSRQLFEKLINWYLTNKRALPWRQNVNPYHIYVSEIVFQQTRIEQGIKYFEAIIGHYPDIASLASAKEKDFLKIWQGLGYYSRAHNMLSAAKQIRDHHKGVIPSDYTQLLQIPGIGPYTAAAIASIAFQQPIPVVDGNVKRLISRLLCLSSPVDSKELTGSITAALSGHIARFKPSDFNQALMEQGALVCTPQRPRCDECAIAQYCCAFRKNTVQNFPVKSLKKQKAVIYHHYYIIQPAAGSKAFYMTKRDIKGLWKGLYEFPCVETSTPGIPRISPRSFLPAKLPITRATEIVTVQHELTHRTIKASFYQLIYTGPVPSNWEKVSLKTALKMPVHKLISTVLSALEQFRSSQS